MRKSLFCLILIMLCHMPVYADAVAGLVWLDGNPSSVTYSDYYHYTEYGSDVFGKIYSFESKQSGTNQMIDFYTGHSMNSGEGAGYIYLSFYYRSFSEFENYLGNTATGNSCMVYPQFRYGSILQDVYMNGSKAFRTELGGSWIKKSVIMKINAASADKAAVNLRFKINSSENFRIDIASPTLIYFGSFDSETEANEKITEYLKDNGYYYNKISQSEEVYSQYGIALTGEFYNNEKNLWQAGKTWDGTVSEHELRNWLNDTLPEIRVNKILSGNYAFVEGRCNYWNKTEVETMNSPVIKNSDGGYMIPGDIAYSLFGCGNGTDYVDTDSIINYNVFTDERGFVLISTNPISDYIDTGLNEGGYYTSAYDVSDCIGTITWSDISPTDSDYEAFMTSWYEDITYPAGCADEFEAYISETISMAASYLELYDSEGVYSPFVDITIPDIASNQTHYLALEEVYSRLRAMAIGYRLALDTGSADTDRLREAVLGGVELMHSKYYTNNAYRIDGTPRFTTFKFKLPEALSDILLCMYGDISEDEIQKYAYEALGRNILPSVTQGSEGRLDYTNRLWATVPYIKLSVLIKDEVRINHGYRYLSQIFDSASRNAEYMLSPNGFYEDGSFVFHDSFSYNLGYGKSYLASVAEFSHTTADTVFDISKVHGYDRLYDRIINSYLPFIFDFKNMKLVAGRENAYSNARTTVAACILIAQNAPDAKKKEIASHIKACLESGTDSVAYLTKKTRFDTFTYLAYPAVVKQTKAYLDYIENVESMGQTYYNKIYYNMDRVLHKAEKFTFGLAMSSSRISKYESSSTKPSSLNQWYTGDGMTYIHNDNNQYNSSWFGTANPYFMPGTTVDSTQRSLEQTFNLSADEWGLPDNDWAGGVSGGTVGAAGMKLGNKWVSGLEGRKSYFMFENEVVCMGSGISGGEGNVYTVADNRKLYKAATAQVTGLPDVGYEDIYLDGEILDTEFNTATEAVNPSFVWAEGNIGYIFGGENRVIIEREEYIEGNPHFVLSISHGENPSGGSYMYTLLPGADLETTAAYAASPDIEVISHTNSIHAVRRKSDGVIAANVFEPGTLLGIEFITPCSVIIDKGMLYVSDPTMKLEKITALYGDEITVDVSRLKGASYSCPLPSVNIYDGDVVYNGEKYTGTALIDNNTGSDKAITVCLAAYSGGALTGCTVQSFDAKAYSMGTALSAEMECPQNGAEEIKMFVWQDLLPLISVISYK